MINLNEMLINLIDFIFTNLIKLVENPHLMELNFLYYINFWLNYVEKCAEQCQYMKNIMSIR